MLQVENAELVGPNALLFLQLLIAFITRSAVNVRVTSNGFLLVSLVTTRVSLEEVCLSSFEVLNCWLTLVANCLDDENEIPLKVIASFSASRFAINSFNCSPQVGQVCLLVHGFNKVSPFFLFVYTDTVLDVFIQSWRFSISSGTGSTWSL